MTTSKRYSVSTMGKQGRQCQGWERRGQGEVDGGSDGPGDGGAGIGVRDGVGQ